MVDDYKMGVYLIVDRITKAVYVGSAATSFRQRWYDHKSELRRGVHPNAYLQNAWNKYGEGGFVFEIAEIVTEKSQVIEREQEWLDACLSSDKVKCYNLAPVAGSQLGHRHTESTKSRIGAFFKGRGQSPEHVSKRFMGKVPIYSFIDPYGNLYEGITDLKAFCDEHGLSRTGMNHVWNGIDQSYKYWTKPGSGITIKQYNLVSPDGRLYRNIVDLSDFCRQHGLNHSNLLKVYNGKKSHHHGWSFYREDGS